MSLKVEPSIQPTAKLFKNRLHATLAKYALNIQGLSDIFGKAGRELIKQRLEQLPPHTRYATERVLKQLEVVESHISLFEQRMREMFWLLMRARPHGSTLAAARRAMGSCGRM